MVTLGGDCHKRTHTLVAVDDNGQQLGAKMVSAVSAGHLEALDWARQWAERRWALENCRHLSRRLEADLLLAGEWLLRCRPNSWPEPVAAPVSGASQIPLTLWL